MQGDWFDRWIIVRVIGACAGKTPLGLLDVEWSRGGNCALKWNATFSKYKLSQRAARFQSTHSCRVRRDLGKHIFLLNIFQSTHSGRVRRCRALLNSVSTNFNPRTQVECDRKQDLCVTSWMYFNPRTQVECNGYILHKGHQKINI